jgi:hypothetical protein
VPVHGVGLGERVGAKVREGDLNGDGQEDLVLVSPEAEGGSGVAWVFFGPIDSARTTDEADLQVFGPPGGAGLDGAMIIDDLDGDGHTDFGLGEPDHEDSGRLWLLPGPLGTDDRVISEASGWTALDGPLPGVRFGQHGRMGRRLEGAATGETLLAVGGHGPQPSTEHGAVLLYTVGDDISASDGPHVVFVNPNGSQNSNLFGSMRADLDLSSDGLADLVMLDTHRISEDGSYRDDHSEFGGNPGNLGGRAYLFVDEDLTDPVDRGRASSAGPVEVDVADPVAFVAGLPAPGALE